MAHFAHDCRTLLRVIQVVLFGRIDMNKGYDKCWPWLALPSSSSHLLCPYSKSSSSNYPMAKALELTSFSRRCLPSLFVLASQVAAATLNAAAKFSETRPEPVHPFMILHIRMLITGLGCTLYLWHMGSSIPETFFGTPEVHYLVLFRAIGGICSATGFFCRSLPSSPS